MISQISLFQAMSAKMDYTTQRHTVLAENIANADTPGYRAQDMEPFAEQFSRSHFGRLSLASTSGTHIRPASLIRDARVDDVGSRYETAPNGNDVVLEQQMIAMGQSVMEHQMVSDLYRRNVGMIRTALGRSGS